MKANAINILAILLFVQSLSGQVITTFAGGGSGGDGIAATSSSLPDPGACFISQNGDFFVASGTGNKIRKIDTSGIITTFAGIGTAGYFGDNGTATASELDFPDGLSFDSLQDIFISDFANDAIRKIDAITNTITTICGDGISGYSGDNGMATGAKIAGPNGICLDKYGRLYIADANNNVIRRIDTNGIIITFAGTGIAGFSGDGGQATNAQLWLPTDVTSDDSNNIFIADLSNSRIRKVNALGIISTFAGNGNAAYIGDGMPATIAQLSPAFIKFDANHNLYASSFGAGNYRVYKIDSANTIHLIAGNGVTGFSGDGGSATNAGIKPGGLTFDKCGNLFISDIANGRIRKVTFNPACWPEKVNEPPIDNIVIYPNPTTTELNIDNVKTGANYVLFNVLGIIEQSGTLKECSNIITINAIPPGIYLLELTDEDGRRTVKKIVKE